MLKKIIIMACLILSLPSLNLAEEWKDKKVDFSLIKHVVVLGPLNNVKEILPQQQSSTQPQTEFVFPNSSTFVQGPIVKSTVETSPSLNDIINGDGTLNSSRREALDDTLLTRIYNKESKRWKNVLIPADQLKGQWLSLTWDNSINDKNNILKILSQESGVKYAEALLVIEINDSGVGENYIPESMDTILVNRPYQQTMYDSSTMRVYTTSIDNYVSETVTKPAHYEYYGWTSGTFKLYDAKSGMLIWSYSKDETDDKMYDAAMHFIKNGLKKLPISKE